MDTRNIAAIAIRQVSRDTGASRIAIGQIKTLSSLGFRVVFLCERGDKITIKDHDAECFKFLRWPFKGKTRRFWFNFRVKQWCKKHNPKIIISHGDVETPHILFMHNCVHLAHERKFNTNAPSPLEVATIHDKIIKEQKYRYLIANSHIMAKEFAKRYEVAEEKIKISYPKYDRKKFNPHSAEKKRAQKRQETGINNDKLLISLITSGDFLVRNVSFFIEIAALLTSRKNGKYSFLIVGKGNKTPYKEKAKKMGIEDNIHWLDTTTDVEAIYGASDMIVLPAHIETFCCVALEAMACGKPVMMSSWIGASELIQDDIPELVMKNYNAEEWCERIEELTAKGVYKDLGLKAQSIAISYAESSRNSPLDELFNNGNLV